jgi:benzylsuccinate CoA-transferase BbsF subunit
LSWGDALIDNQPPTYLEARGLGPEELQALYPKLVYTSITPYGRWGAQSSVPGDELTLTQAGGLGNLLPSRSVDVDRAPAMLGGCQVGYHGAIVAALATAGALLGQRRGAGGCVIDVSLQEVVLSLVSPLVPGPRYQDTTWRRVPDRPPAMGRMQTADGYVILNAFDDHHFAALRELMGNPEWCSSPEWDSMEYRAHHLMDVAPLIDAWMLGQKKNEIHRRAGQRGIPIGPINDARDVMDNPQFEARGFFVEVEDPGVGRFRYPGWPYKMSASPAAVACPAPKLGSQREAPAASATTARSHEMVPPRNIRRPLEGVRVLELCWVWAGPYAGSLLAALGAEVIKVEGHRRMDLTRRGVIWPLPEPAPSSVPKNQAMAFNQVNMGKKSLTVDISKPEGVDLVLRLAKESDVVIDNMRPGALDKRGLGYEGLRAQRRDIIVGSSSGRGYVGDEKDFLGYAMIHQGIGGGAYITGYPDDHPCHSGGDVDLMNAMTLAFAVVAALHHRAQSGEGQFIDYSQCEGVSSLLGEVLLGYQMTGEVPERQGNAHPTHAPHNVYRAWGVDRWVALEIHTDEEFGKLCDLLGRGELARDPRFATEPARKENEAELDDLLTVWTRERDRDWIVSSLTGLGLAAAPSRDARDLYADRHLRERQAFVRVEHPELGELELVAAPWLVDGERPETSCAPSLGQHTDEILGDLLGLDADRIAALREGDVIL